MTGTAQTPLHDWHVAHGGRMVPFAGWSMPVQYESIVAEHLATRSAAGLFDISHMGRLRFDGSDAGAFLEGLLTRRMSDLKPGQIRYSLVTNDAGGILDDVLVYRLAGAGREPYHLMVVNASNREKILAWIQARLAGQDIGLRDQTHELAMIAVQGPRALDLLAPLVSAPLALMKYYHAAEAEIGGQPAIVSRTGYTGEDGFEIMLPAESAVRLWESLLDRGHSSGARAAGLGARDTLRLEAGMPLYGHELSEQITPLEAGLEFAVNLEGRSFPGRDALAKIKESPLPRRRIGLELDGKRVPREKYPVLAKEQQVGEITSGTFSPTFNKPIAMAYVDSQFASPGTELSVDIRGSRQPARVVPLPFYRRAS